jgi:hypothetical protein
MKGGKGYTVQIGANNANCKDVTNLTASVKNAIKSCLVNS